MRAHEVLSEAILYRGDSSHVDAFDTAKSGHFLLYTPGTYLTDSPEVAGDYTLKDSENVVFTDDTGATDVKDVVLHYLGKLLATQTEWPAAKKNLYNEYIQKLYDDPEYQEADSSPYTDEKRKRKYEITRRFEEMMSAATDKLRGRLLAKVKKTFKAEADTLRVVRATNGEWSIVKADRTGHISMFDIPEEYLARTLHAERPLPKKVVKAIRDLWFETYRRNGHDPETKKFDMRDPDGNFMKFDDWVKAYRTTGVDFAWRDEDRIVGGKGELPDLDTFWHGTHWGGSWFLDKANMVAFVKAMVALGYVGLEYDGGKRVGAHVRGGGGVLHRAYVFWNDAEINRFRTSSEKVRDLQGAAGAEKGARHSHLFRQHVERYAA